MLAFFINLTAAHHILIYLAIFLGMFIEGEIILVMTGVLVKGNIIGFFPSVLTAFVGIVSCDVFYWNLGKKLKDTGREKFLFFTVKNTAPILRRLEKNGEFWIFLSKFTWNLNRIFLICAGYVKISFKKLLKYSALASLIWTTMLISLGYIFAHQTEILKHELKRAALFLALLMIGILTLEIVLKKAFNMLNNKNRNGRV